MKEALAHINTHIYHDICTTGVTSGTLNSDTTCGTELTSNSQSFTEGTLSSGTGRSCEGNSQLVVCCKSCTPTEPNGTKLTSDSQSLRTNL